MRLVIFILTAAMAAMPVLAQKQESPDSKGAGHEGIKIHGHWVLEIKNPDGSLVKRSEFENSLLSGGAGNGAGLAAAFISGSLTPGIWTISIPLQSTNGYSIELTQTAAMCAQFVTSGQAGVCGTGLMVIPPGNSPPPVIVLQGTTPAATQSGTIVGVSTAMTFCPTNIAPASCTSGQNNSQTQFGGQGFTGTNLSNLSVQVGQIITVTVTFSFS